MDVNFDFQFRQEGEALLIQVGDVSIRAMKPDPCSIRIEYPGREREMAMEIKESIETSDFLATYVVAEVFKHIMDLNRHVKKDRLMEIYDFFNQPRCRELEEALIRLSA
ncbi:MAG TPA: hypothetical protein PLF44_03635 [Candidatus Mcinerneyibacteriales bacterium]|nr:hypothetical protein [Candidatus Mcinerneyibacteriota bacterium]HOO60707.1 hypothetical protein [Candidatus Mcinerneyibacteriales bacterium]HPE20734.1 hypothetical protein [Candidatus Mcinerneyibacteriales bacterium]HPJ69952.1 hypothetical protein [Candidatus Mcinerneyibacteriales bacterium]HPQ89482.1 hypothetical protein [Candidatus Mcinerneyibacteriales bacterium]